MTTKVMCFSYDENFGYQKSQEMSLTYLQGDELLAALSSQNHNSIFVEVSADGIALLDNRDIKIPCIEK